MTVAKTILEQLGGRRFIAMTGANSLTDHGNALSFRIGSGAKKKISLVKITLTDADLYDMEFGKVYRGYKEVERVDGLYFDQLQDIFTQVTGFYTHL